MSKKIAEERVLNYVQESHRPTLVGHVALGLNCSLAEAECALLELVADGRIRHVTAAEMDRYDIRDGFLPV